MENNNDIDDLFKDLIEPHEMNHSEKVWASLDKQLDKKANDRNRVIIFRLKMALGIVLFLFSSFGLFYYFNYSKDKNAFLISEKQKNNAENKNLQNTIIEKIYTPITNTEYVSSTGKKQKFKNELALKESAVNTTSANSTYSTSLNKVLKIKSKTIINYASNANTIALNTIAKSNSSTNSNQPLLSDIQNTVAEISVDTINSIVLNNIKPIDTVFDSSIVHIANKDSVRDIPNSTLPILLTSKEKIDSIQKQQLKNRFSIITYFSPDFTMKYLKEDTETNHDKNHENKKDYEQEEAPDFSFNTGLLVGYDLTKNWSVKFGGTYNFLAQTINPKIAYAKTGTSGLVHYQFNTSYGTSEIPNDLGSAPIVGDSIIINSKSTQVLHVIGVPVIAKYQITRNKFSYYAQLGASFNFIAGQKLIVETPTKTETIKKVEGLNQYYYGGIIGLGVSYNPIKKLSILFEPTMKGAITPINKNTPISTRPISLGLALGISWHF